ncbi:MAG: hypothetical protein IJR66_05370 [Clostridia bacterium]|nr:hypothetical protein [Clostridia bacterium]
MAQKKGGLIERLIVGSEKSEGYARASLPSNRWELFWDIFKGRFWKLVIVNFLMLIFFLPLFAFLLFRSGTIVGYSIQSPYSQCFGVGYQSVSSYVGFPEKIIANVNLNIGLFLPVVCLIASIGVAGGAYVIRNMVWTEGIFVANDFWRGIKLNIKNMLLIALVYSLLLYIGILSISFSNMQYQVGGGKKWLIFISQAITYISLGVFTVMMLHMITMSETYIVPFVKLVKNAFLFTVGLLPQNVFFIAIGLIPLLLIQFSGFIASIGYMLILFIWLSVFLLMWTDYCQWAYDKFINDKVEGAKKNRGIYEKIKASDSKAIEQYREQLAIYGNSSLSSRPIKPITDEEITIAELPESFNRDDILKLNKSKEELYEDNRKYVEEHKNDPEFIKAEEEKQKLSEEEKKRQERIENAKRELSKRNKK